MNRKAPLSSVGRYEMLAPIAAGGMASVWAARRRGANGFAKLVAIKSMLPDLANDVDYRTMFIDEARVASKLRHPNVCETFDLGEEGGALFIAMEWVDGASLHRVVRTDDGEVVPIAVELAARIVANASAGLHAVHEAVDDDGVALAIVHRDMSPQNLLLSIDGQIKVTDFGIAKSRRKEHATAAGQAKGKLAYMAPEQLRDVTVDRRADVFALGCVLYEITTGKKPFDARSDAELMRAVLACEPKRPSALVASYPLELERIVMRALAKEPDARFSSAEGFRLALESWLSSRGRPVSTRDVAALVEERCGREIALRRAQIQRMCGSDAERERVVAEPDRAFWGTLALGVSVVALGVGSLLAHAPLSTEDPHARQRPVAAASAPAIVLASTRRPPSDSILFRLDPPDAEVVLDGERLENHGGTPSVERPSASSMRVLLVRAPGRVDRLVAIEAGMPSTIDVVLDVAEPTSLADGEP